MTWEFKMLATLIVLAVGMIGYTFGHTEGRESAPEYVAMTEERDTRRNADLAALDAEYEASIENAVFDMCLDLVEQRHFDDWNCSDCE